ncbi:hypothetical protein [Microbacterium gilvum]|uniref:Uncharacterized protein n=1 Tax=Microbacterium gilvum TaxID=1336204 RepID=A0ABP9A0E6_9MICO
MDIGSGGAVSVDPADLRRVATEVSVRGRAVAEAGERVRAVAAALEHLPVTLDGLFAQAVAVDAEAEQIEGVAGALRFAADAYELVELKARAESERLDREVRLRMVELEARSPGAGDEAERLLRTWRSDDELSVNAQFLPLSWIPAVGAPLSFTARTLLGALLHQPTAHGAGRIDRGAQLRGASAHPRLRPGVQGVPGTAPATVGDVAARVPDGGTATIRVERYTWDDGRREFAVYVAGTQGEGGTVLDWGSNLELYGGGRSQAFQAVEDALAAAGARDGDVLHATGLSQGAMIASWLAAEGRYDVQTLVTLGAPVEAHGGGETLMATIRHEEDPVALLAGGYPYRTGAEGSVVVSHPHEPVPALRDLAVSVHRLDAYVETARAFDASGDPRAAELAARIAELGGAQTVEVFEFLPERLRVSERAAEGVSGSASPAGGG